MDLFTADFETAYAKGYSLSGMSTEEYVRNDQFEAILLSIKRNDEPAIVIPGPKIIPALDKLRPHLEKSALLCHHAQFDGLILNHHYGIKPKMWFDTLSMARALHGVSVGGSLAKLAAHYELGQKGVEVHNMMGKRLADITPAELNAYGEYCKNDTELTYALFQRMVPHFKKSELHTIDIIVRMFTEPVLRIDCGLAEAWGKEIRANKARLVIECGVSKDTLMSNDQFAIALNNALAPHGQSAPKKKSPANGQMTWAFAKSDEEFIALREHPDEKVQALVEARLGNKTTINETRALKFAAMGERGAAPVYINYAGAKQTMRTSGGDKCLIGSTVITVLRKGCILDVPLSTLDLSDLVWDGEEFVPHEGLVYQGIREVISYDGVSGTPGHKVFCDETREAVELSEAHARGYHLTAPQTP